MKRLGILGIDGALYLSKWKYLPKVANSYKNVWKIDIICIGKFLLKVRRTHKIWKERVYT